MIRREGLLLLASVGALAASTAASARNTVFLLLLVGNRTVKSASKISGSFSDDAIGYWGHTFDLTAGSPATGPGRASHRPTFARLAFRNRVDATSPPIMRGAHRGGTIG